MSTCPVCGKSDLVQDAEVAHCRTCDHIFQTPPDMTAKYDKEYVASRYDKYDTTQSMSHLRLGLVSAFAKKGRLLDVGYGNGSFVKLANKAGFDGYGTDVHGADYGVKEVPLKNDMNWEVVTFFDSLEHFESFHDIRMLAKWARVIVVSFPFRPGTFPENKNWKHYRPGEHLHYFSVESLSCLFQGKRQVFVGNIEDVVRGTNNDEPNIMTVVFSS